MSKAMKDIAAVMRERMMISLEYRGTGTHGPCGYATKPDAECIAAADELDRLRIRIAELGDQAMNTQEIAAKIARAIFECGDEPERLGGKTTRIQFRGRNDLGMGGLAEEPLARVIADALHRAVKP